MILRLSVLVVLACLVAGLQATNQWELAVAVGDKIELLDRKGALHGLTLQHFRSVKGLAFDEKRHQFIVSDMQGQNDSIFKVQLTEKSEVVPLVSDIPDDVKNIALDPLTDTIYWTDSLTKKIYKMSITDTNAKPEILFNFEEDLRPVGIAVDPIEKKLYWSHTSRIVSTMERSNLDGTNRETIVKDLTPFMPSGITIDQKTRRIYWGGMEGIYFRMESSKLDGSDRQILFQNTHQAPYGIAVSNDTVYWTDKANNALWAMKKDGNGGAPEKIREFSEMPKGIVFVVRDIEIITTDSLPIDNEVFEVASDSDYCLNFGELTAHGCKCNRGFTGVRCEMNVCQNFCVNGDCTFSSEGYPQCKCAIGFIGTRCEHEICNDFCLNGGKCQPSNGTWAVECECGPNFSGRRCERVNDVETLCSMMCEEEKVEILLSDDNTGRKCRCSNKKDSYVVISNKLNATAESLYAPSLESQFTEKLKDPIVLASWVLTLLMMFTIVGLCVMLCRLRLRRPRIKKRIIVNKNITPLTYRPGQSTEQCEITIENCCNMNICETPCFDPPKMGFQYKKADEKKTLLTSMENGEDIY